MKRRLEMRQENFISSKGRETRATANLFQVMSFTATKWREDPGLLSRPCRKRRPSAREDGGVSGVSWRWTDCLPLSHLGSPDTPHRGLNKMIPIQPVLGEPVRRINGCEADTWCAPARFVGQDRAGRLGRAHCRGPGTAGDTSQATGRPEGMPTKEGYPVWIQ